ncbi:MAG: hypothetical protein JNK82_41595 [Myxococcaceae bacterium]|nr:hypothetical protein [Myxococcaceae bacterium]
MKTQSLTAVSLIALAACFSAPTKGDRSTEDGQQVLRFDALRDGKRLAKVEVKTDDTGTSLTARAEDGAHYEITVSRERHLRLDYSSANADKRYFVQHLITGPLSSAPSSIPALVKPFDGEDGAVSNALLTAVLGSLQSVAALPAELQLSAELALAVQEVEAIAPTLKMEPLRIGPEGQVATGTARQAIHTADASVTAPVPPAPPQDCPNGGARVPRAWDSTCLESDLAVPGYFSAHVTVGKAKGTSLCCPQSAPSSVCRGKLSKSFENGDYAGCPSGFKDWRYTVSGGISAAAEQENPGCLADTINDEATVGKVVISVLGVDIWKLKLFSDTGDMMTCQWANVGGVANFCGKGTGKSEKNMQLLNETFVGQAGKDRECEWVDWVPVDASSTKTETK